MSEKFMEYVSCAVCGESTSEPYFQNVQNRLNIGEIFTIVECTNCGIKYLNPRPTIDGIEKYYDVEEYHPHKISEESLIDKIYIKVRDINIKTKMKLFNKLSPQKKTLLDIGCGTGELLKAMKNNGWDIAGMETAKEARELAAEDNIQIFSNLEDINTQFHIISMWHVLEHIHDIPKLMHQINRLLENDGILILAVPNIKCVDSKFYKSNWIALDTPRHLYHFSPKDIITLLEKYNFKVFRISNKLYFDVWYNVLLSAQHQSKVEKKNLTVWDILKAGMIGKVSFLNGLMNPLKTSSPIYIARKNS